MTAPKAEAALSTAVDELFSEWNKPDSPGFAVAIIQNGGIIYERGYGMADLEHDIPISPTSVFDIGSTSKQFTALCVVLLARQGKLSLDDEVQKYITEMPRYKHPVTIRHLIHHTSGIRDYLTLMDLAGMRYENEYPDDEVIRLVARQKELNFRPGDEHLYSNSGYLLLAEIAKRAAGIPLSVFAEEHIFKPLGMTNTHFHDDFTRIVKNRAIGYSPKSAGGFQIDMSIFDVVGDGAVYTTVEDLYRWDQNFYHNILGGDGQDLIDEICTPGSLNSGEALEYAFGLAVERYHGLKLVSHGGAWAGYRADMLRFPEQRFSVICLSNLGSTNPTGLAKQIADLYLADKFTERHEEKPTPDAAQVAQVIELPAAELEDKAGFYRSIKSGVIWELAVKDGKLFIEIFGLSIALAPASSTRFLAVDFIYRVELEFETPDADAAAQVSVRIEDDKPDVFQRLKSVALNPDQLQEFAGAYHCAELEATYKISMEEGKLLLKRKNSPPETLKPTSQDLLKGTHATFQFTRDKHQRVAGFNLDAGRVRNIRFVKTG